MVGGAGDFFCKAVDFFAFLDAGDEDTFVLDAAGRSGEDPIIFGGSANSRPARSFTSLPFALEMVLFGEPTGDPPAGVAVAVFFFAPVTEALELPRDTGASEETAVDFFDGAIDSTLRTVF